MMIKQSALLVLALTLCSLCAGQAHEPPKKHLLVLGEEKGYRHDSVSHALATIEHLGDKTGLWETTIRTDTEAVTKKKLEVWRGRTEVEDRMRRLLRPPG